MNERGGVVVALRDCRQQVVVGGRLTVWGVVMAIPGFRKEDSCPSGGAGAVLERKGKRSG